MAPKYPKDDWMELPMPRNVQSNDNFKAASTPINYYISSSTFKHISYNQRNQKLNINITIFSRDFTAYFIINGYKERMSIIWNIGY